MPTAAKLVAAICFAIIGYIATEVFKPELPIGTQVVWFSWINAVLGVLVGWTIMGRQVGAGIRAAVRRGIGVSVWLLFWSDAVFSLRDMLIKSTKFTYKTPTKAVLAVFDNLWSFLLMALTPSVILTLIVGGIIAGILAEISHKTWR